MDVRVRWSEQFLGRACCLPRGPSVGGAGQLRVLEHRPQWGEGEFLPERPPWEHLEVGDGDCPTPSLALPP